MYWNTHHWRAKYCDSGTLEKKDYSRLISLGTVTCSWEGGWLSLSLPYPPGLSQVGEG